MNKSILTAATFLKQGKAVTIVGPHGCGKFHVATEAAKYLNLVPKIYDFRKGFSPYSEEDFKTFSKNRYGNNLFILDNIQTLPPDLMVDILLLIKNPEINIVFLGMGEYISSIILNRSVVCRMVFVCDDHSFGNELRVLK